MWGSFSLPTSIFSLLCLTDANGRSTGDLEQPRVSFAGCSTLSRANVSRARPLCPSR